MPLGVFKLCHHYLFYLISAILELLKCSIIQVRKSTFWSKKILLIIIIIIFIYITMKV